MPLGYSRKGGSGVNQAKVAELVDALDLGSSGVTRESSSLSFRTRLPLLSISSAVRFARWIVY